MGFELPAEAVVYDSWLWIGEDTIRADIRDKWTASLIYEQIVNRRRDPSLLVKLTSTRYELRIFPMAGNETRKARISYLMPASWNKREVSAALPAGIISSSHVPLPHLLVKAGVTDQWRDPRIVQNDGFTFTPGTGPDPHAYMELEIPSEALDQGMRIGYRSPMDDGIFLSIYEQGNEGIYQLAFFPVDLLDTLAGNKVAILVDFDPSNTHLSRDQLLETVREEVLGNLNPRDSFNLMVSNLAIQRYSERWVAATPENIHAAFDSLDRSLANYSNLASLLASGIGFIGNQGEKGQVVLITDADQYSNFEIANTLISDIQALTEKKIPIHIADYQSTDVAEYNFSNKYYIGNGYLYSNLAKLTGGSCQRVLEGLPYGECIGLSLRYSGGSIRAFDLHTSLDEGFCHSRYDVGRTGNLAYLQEAIMQTGKYRGTFPFRVEVSGEYGDQVFSETLQIDADQAMASDSLSQEIWTGQYIRQLESASQTNDLINEIIYYSLTERVLSKYTSFLCLEPGFDPGEIREEEGEDWGDWIPILVEPLEEADFLSVFPNPFTDYITIQLGETLPGEVLEIAVYSMTGVLLVQFDAGEFTGNGTRSFTWNGQTDSGEAIQPGMYLLVCRTSEISKTVKLIRQ